MLTVLFVLLFSSTQVSVRPTQDRQHFPVDFLEEKTEPSYPKQDPVPKIIRENQSSFIPILYGDATKITFSNGISFDTKTLGKSGEPDLPQDLIYQDGESPYYIVQFSGPIYQEQKAWLEASGATIHFCIPRYGFVCSIKNRAEVDQIRANVAVNWVGLYQPAYKISRLFDQLGQDHETIMLLFNDTDINEVLQQIKTITRNSEFTTVDNGVNKLIQGVVNKNDIKKLAQLKEAYWIGPHIRPEQHLTNVVWIVQSGDNIGFARPIWAHGIHGEGEIVNNTDSGIDTDHPCFIPPIPNFGYYPLHRKVIAYDSGGPNIVFGDHSSFSYHGTTTAQILCGKDTISIYYDGIAYEAKNYHLDIGDDQGYLSIWGDYYSCWIRTYEKYYPAIRAHMSSNSWGAAVSGEYSPSSMAADQVMWYCKDYLLFFSNGNSFGPGTVGAPATAKNVVSLGGIRSGTGTNFQRFYTSTSRGPCQDGRQKPTLLTPGGQIHLRPGSSGISGTSLSAPSAAGAGALVRQYLREGWYPTGKKTVGDEWSFISASMVKALLINSCDNDIIGYTVPDNNVGWGRLTLDSSMFFAGDARKTILVENTVGILTGERVDYHVNVPLGASHLRVALVWTDYPGNPAVLPNIVNDLDLVAYRGATYYRGNQYSGGQSVADPPGRDNLNVEECIRRNSPTAGDWRISVEGRNVLVGPQPYSLVVCYTAAQQAGVVSLDKPVYRANDFTIDTVNIRIEDTNRGSAGSIDNVRAIVTSSLVEAQPETVWCTELAESAYVFTGNFRLLFDRATHGDGRLSVCQGDTIHVSYVDNSPSYTSSTWAGVDAMYFVITNVRCENIQATLADVCWTTSENANSWVRYGVDPGNLNQSAGADTPYVLPHTVRLSNLNPKTTYYYDVESRDFRGNLAIDDNGGNHYSFTTGELAGVDIFVAFLDGVDKATPSGQAIPLVREKFRSAVEFGGWTYVWWETSDHDGDLPPRDIIKEFKAVAVPNEDEYPPYLRGHQDTITRYLEGGGRITYMAHDFLWYAWDFSPVPGFDTMWCKNYLNARYSFDITPPGSYNIYGVAGDPITGPYTGGVFYSPHRDGACGDELVGINNPPNGWATGQSSYIWHWNAVGGMNIGSKWESNENHGTPGDGVWGGRRCRSVMNAFTATQLDTVELPGILNSIFIWLIGHDHPDITITSPVGGNTYNSSPISINWTAAAYGGATLDTTWLEYSPDNGQTWIEITHAANMTPPYSWDVSALTNGPQYQVRATVSDKDVYPSMKGIDKTGNFTLAIPGNDNLGPKVLPQSIWVQENPMFVTPTHKLLPFGAVVNDSFTGGSIVNAAEWSIGSSPLPPGTGVSMFASDGSWNQLQEAVAETIFCVHSPGTRLVCSLWVRGRDNAPNWGPALMRTFTLIDGQIIVGVSESGKLIPISYSLSNPMPNPFLNHVSIVYGIPRMNKVALKVYNSLGQVVKTLVDDRVEPGIYNITWDGTDNRNRKVSAGVYFYKLSTDEFKDTKKVIMIR
jgi:hypothetical protein